MDDLKTTYNRIAKDWHQDHRDDTWWIEGTDKFLSFLKAGDAVLDVGCGAGTKSKYLIGKGFKVAGIDFSEQMIEIAKRNVPQGRFFVMDLTDMGGLQEKFDGILAQAVLLHVPKKKIALALEQLRGKLKPGGYLYVAVKEIKPGSPEEATVTENDYGYPYSRFFSYFTSAEMRKYLEDTGMKVVHESIITSGKTNWIQIVAQYHNFA